MMACGKIQKSGGGFRTAHDQVEISTSTCKRESFSSMFHHRKQASMKKYQISN
jgi:hypothetical protein